jgi:hypothetical protein
MSDTPATDAISAWPKNVLEAVAEALDRQLGDSDLTHFECDQDVRDHAPLQWACSQINKLLNAAPQDAKPLGAEVNLPVVAAPFHLCPHCAQSTGNHHLRGCWSLRKKRK